MASVPVPPGLLFGSGRDYTDFLIRFQPEKQAFERYCHWLSTDLSYKEFCTRERYDLQKAVDKTSEDMANIIAMKCYGRSLGD